MASVALILGAGPRIGASVAEKFAAEGYKIAVASRKGTNSKDDKGYFSIKADFATPKSVPAVFDAVEAEFKTTPSVVIYNAATMTPPPDKASPLSIPAEAFESNLTINSVSPYVAAQQAVARWESLPKDTKKTFIYTGNGLNAMVLPVPVMLTLGVGKSAAAYWIGVADSAYRERGYRFFYADERYEDGKVKGGAIDGPAHAEFYSTLAKQEGDIPWQATFLDGKGYVKF